MYCAKCGTTFEFGMAFCAKCGQSKIENQRIEMATANQNLLISGNGKHMMAKVYIGIFSILFFVSLAVFSLVANPPSYSPRNVKDMFVLLKVISFIFCLSMGFFQTVMLGINLTSSKTNISVYENSVSGTGLINAFSPQTFNLSFGDIKNVYIDNIRKSTIVLQTQYAKYTCYAKNYVEINNIMLSRLNQHSNKI